MPVYLFTIHAYRSWSEGNSKGYIQRDEGLQPPSPRLAQWRAGHSSHDPARFDGSDQDLLHQVLVDIVAEKKCRLHAASATSTHIHALNSFELPECGCHGSEWCQRGCAGKSHVEKLIVLLKAKNGSSFCQKT